MTKHPHHWITASTLRFDDRGALVMDERSKIQLCFFCAVEKTPENADAECDKRPRKK